MTVLDLKAHMRLDQDVDAKQVGEMLDAAIRLAMADRKVTGTWTYHVEDSTPKEPKWRKREGAHELQIGKSVAVVRKVDRRHVTAEIMSDGPVVWSRSFDKLVQAKAVAGKELKRIVHALHSDD